MFQKESTASVADAATYKSTVSTARRTERSASWPLRQRRHGTIEMYTRPQATEI